jgi:uncharacterized membrane protein YagU involved in acid resistance
MTKFNNLECNRLLTVYYLHKAKAYKITFLLHFIKSLVFAFDVLCVI